MDGINKKDRVIYILAMPSASHLNPALCFTNQLVEKLDKINVSKIIFYSTPQFFERILNLPNNKNNRIEVRDFYFEKYIGNPDLLKSMMNFDTQAGKIFRFFKCFENGFKIGSMQIIQHLVESMHKDKPVLGKFFKCLRRKCLTNSKFKCS
jgi:hypothetical protein